MNPFNIFLWIWSRILWWVFLFCGTKLFNEVVVDTDDKDIVICVMFRNRND